MKIASVRHAFPQNEYSQQQLTDSLSKGWKRKFFNVERLRQFHKNLLVGTRRFCVTIEELETLNGFQARNDLYITHAVNLGEQAIQQSLESIGFQPDQIDHLFFTSITGIAAPSIDALLINRMNMKPNIKRTPLFGLGCLGGAAGIARAMDYVKAYPDQIVVLLSVELCSLTMQKDDLSIPNIVGTGLFGDGAAAVVIVGDAVDVQGPRLLKSFSSFYHDTERIMGWDIVDEGFKIVLSPNVPKMVKKHAKNDVAAFLCETEVTLDQIKYYICHPGGPKVLEAFQNTLNLPKEKFQLSWKTLEEIGNLSSTSVLLVLEETIDTMNPKAGDYGILMAMGPGFCSEWVLLQW